MDVSEEGLSLDAIARIDAICVRFERTWKCGGTPEVDVFVREVSADAERVVLTRELLALEDHYRGQRGDAAAVTRNNVAFESAATEVSVGSRVCASPPLPAEIPGYEILHELGRGGMGVVYKAMQTRLKRTVALKMILAGGHAGDAQLERFRTEAQAIARLQHPNIVQIHEVGEHDGLPYFALEFCSGGSLEKTLAGTPVPARPAAALIEKLAHAVHAVHDKGIIHRDLKPANVLLQTSESGSQIENPDAQSAISTLQSAIPKITDFGLARNLGEARQTASGAVMGTPSYMSPEQAGGKTKELSPACDIYALGAILYECVTGRPPFRAATSLDTLLQVVNTEPVGPRQLNAHIPADLETICLKCLQKEPARRYMTAAALADDLHRFLADEPIAARPVSRTARLARWCRRNPLVAATSAATILLLVLIVVGSTVAALLFNKERLRALDNLHRALTAEKEKTEQLLVSHFAEAQARRWSGQAGRRFLSLAALKKAAAIRPTLELRNEAIACMALLDLRVAREWDGCPGNIGQIPHLVFDAKLQRYARSDARGNISVRRVADDGEILSLPGVPGKVVASLLFRPDGQQVAVCHFPAGQYHDNVVFLWDVESGRKILHLERQIHRRAMAFSCDGALFALGCQDRSLRMYDTATGSEVRRHASDELIYSIHFHPDERKLAIRHLRGARIQEAASGKTICSLVSKDEFLDLAWHPDGDMLAGAVGDRILLWDARTGAVLRTLEGHPDSVVELLVFNHAGDLLASKGWDAELKLWDPATGKQLLNVDNVDMRSWGPAIQFSPDDKLLGYNIRGAKVQLWEVARSRECLQLYGTGQRDADFHPDGRLAAVADTKGVRLWDLERGEQLAFLALPNGRSVRFHPDGKSLFTCGGSGGLRRWPIHQLPGSSQLRIGPPQSLWAASGIGEAALSSDGTRIVATSYGGKGALIDLDAPEKKVWFKDHTRMIFVAVSPDGRWLATGGWEAAGVKIWDGKTGAFVRDLPAELYSARVQFSPDGRWLVTSESDEYRFWEVGSWQPGLRLPRTRSGKSGPIAFSPDASIAALASTPNTIQLIDVAKGMEIATLIPADRRKFEGLRFNRDGSRLAVSANGILQGWDLRRLRAGLAELGLDWDAPSYPPADMPADAARPGPLQVEVVGGSGGRLSDPP